MIILSSRGQYQGKMCATFRTVCWQILSVSHKLKPGVMRPVTAPTRAAACVSLLLSRACTFAGPVDTVEHGDEDDEEITIVGSGSRSDTCCDVEA